MKKLTENSFPSIKGLPSPEILGWRPVCSERLISTPIFGIDKVAKTNQKGESFDFIEVDAPEWVSVIPVFTGTDGVRRFVMERQFRQGSDSICLEFPGGLVEKEEDPTDAARRELLEETGLYAHSMRLLGKLSPNAAFMKNTLHVFLAEDLEDTGSFHWDEQESMDIFTMPEEQVLRSMGEGEMSNGIMLTAAYFYLKEKGFTL